MFSFCIVLFSTFTFYMFCSEMKFIIIAGKYFLIFSFCLGVYLIVFDDCLLFYAILRWSLILLVYFGEVFALQRI